MDKKALLSTLDRIIETKVEMIRQTYSEVAPKEVEKEIKSDALYGLLFRDISEFYVQSVLGGRITTSLHRNFGDIVEMSVREIFKSAFDLDDQLAQSSFTLKSIEKRSTRTTDVTLPYTALEEKTVGRLRAFHEQLCKRHRRDVEGLHATCKGVGYEVRQCYKSNDSKRRTADIDMSHLLANKGLAPVMLIFCSSSSASIIQDYNRLSKWLILEGTAAFEYVNDVTGFNYRAYLDSKIEKLAPQLRSLFQVD